MGDIRVSIDRGGTFCDVIATGADGNDPFIFKLLSEDPSNYPDAPAEAIRRVLEKYEGKTIPVGEKLDASRIGEFSCQIISFVADKYRSIMPYRYHGCDECSPHGQWREVCFCNYQKLQRRLRYWRSVSS